MNNIKYLNLDLHDWLEIETLVNKELNEASNEDQDVTANESDEKKLCVHDKNCTLAACPFSHDESIYCRHKE